MVSGLLLFCPHGRGSWVSNTFLTPARQQGGHFIGNGLPRIRFHELRHSCASLLLSHGFTLKDVQEWLGHSDIKMTANVYGHLDVARKQSIADEMSALLSGRR